MTFEFMRKVAAYLAVGFAPVLAIVETVHNWGDWSDPALWIIDYVACLLLGIGAYMVLTGQLKKGLGVLAAGWGFACAIFWMAYFILRGYVETGLQPVEPVVLTGAFGLFVWSLLGFAFSLGAVVKQP